MSLLAVGHKRTGACPTFEHPVIQRDGHLVRVPLVGGALSPQQARAVAAVEAAHGTGVIELTNRGNLQIRGVRGPGVADALAALRAVGLGGRDAALVTISPFAGAREHSQRSTLVAALDAALAAGPPLAPKFVVHVDDDGERTAGRRAEAVLAPVDGSWRLTIAGLGRQVVSADAAVAAVVALAAICRAEGGHARVADAIEAHGVVAVRTRLPLAADGWSPVAPVPAPLTAPLGAALSADGSAVVWAAARLGRVDATTLAALADVVDGLPGSAVHVTPWRSFALLLLLPVGAAVDEVLAALSATGLIVDDADPAAGVIACIGAAGCWQTEADTLAEAERQIAQNAQNAQNGAARGVLHVSGCDKRCATRAPVAVTVLGRPDGSGFDEVPAA